MKPDSGYPPFSVGLGAVQPAEMRLEYQRSERRASTFSINASGTTDIPEFSAIGAKNEQRRRRTVTDSKTHPKRIMQVFIAICSFLLIFEFTGTHYLLRHINYNEKI
jgi:hypothetical protein